jgi:transposase InsO family protein
MWGIAWAARRSPGFQKHTVYHPCRRARRRGRRFFARTGARSPGPISSRPEVWTWRGLVTFYTVFVIDLASRRLQIVGSTPSPNEFFMGQVSRTLTATDGLLSDHRVLICDRDRKWSREVRRELDDAGVHVALTPFQAPNANAHAERLVRSIKYECLDRMVPLGEAISDGPSRNLLITTIANGIIKDSRIGSSRRTRIVDARAGFVGVRGSVDC